MTDNAGYRPTDDSALRWEDCHCTKCGQPDKKCECVALTPGTKPTLPSKENALVEGEKFTTAWLNIDKFPGGMMMSSHGGRFGPVPAMTGCLITTSATTVEEWRLKGMSVIEVQLRNAPETLPPRITVMDDGRAMGGSDVCHTCEAHCTVINDLQTALRGLYWDNVDYLTLNKLGGMQNHWMRAARMALGMDVDDVRHSEKAVDQRAIDANALADAHRMYEAEHDHPFSESEV